MDKSKIIKMIIILAAITVIAGSLSRLAQGDSMSLTEYAKLNASNSPENTSDAWQEPVPSASEIKESATENLQPSQEGVPSSPETPPSETASLLIGATLNGSSQSASRVTYSEGFYYEPVSENLRRYMTGVSYPSQGDETGAAAPETAIEELRYVHIRHYDFDGNPAEGELICSKTIAQDLVEIFHELYRSEYQLERVLLIDEYDGDATASMEANNSFCFHYPPRGQEDEDSELSTHAYGLAVDINPFYNPYVTYRDGEEQVSPESALAYADRSSGFAYKIDENDLCYRLFTRHGFLWGGDWNHAKDYGHFQKNPYASESP